MSDQEPSEIIQNAWEENAPILENTVGPTEMGDATESLLEASVAAYTAGMDRPTIDMWLREIADRTSYTIPGLQEMFEEQLDEAEQEREDINPRLDRFLLNCLNRVVVRRVTDHSVDTSYQWYVDGPDGEVVFPTTGGEHWDWSTFRERYFDETGIDLERPSREHRDAEAWRNFLVERIDTYGEEQEVVGPRTQTVDAVREFIERHTAYPSLEVAAQRNELYMPTEEADGLWVPSNEIHRICNENEVSLRGLQEELYARDLTRGGRRVAKRERVNGTRFTWWQLDAEIASPNEFEPDPQSPAEQVRDEEGPGVINRTDEDDNPFR